MQATLSANTWSSTDSGEDPPVAVTVTGGTAPFTFQWQRVSGTIPIVADSPTATSTTWTYTGTSITPPFRSAVWKVVVTDATSATVSSPNVTVTIQVD